MQRPPSLHANFFSSLKQVEKRLKLENETPSPTIDSLGTPMYLHTDQQANNSRFNTLQEEEESSGPPSAFLSLSPAQVQHQKGPPLETSLDQSTGVDEIGRLMQLLGLSGFEEKRHGEGKVGIFSGGGCEAGFYEKVVGVKGVKCKEEVERMDGWIRWFIGGGEERKEPLRLAFLLLGKAAFELETIGSGGGGGLLEFPAAVEEFLKFDPPTELETT